MEGSFDRHYIYGSSRRCFMCHLHIYTDETMIHQFIAPSATHVNAKEASHPVQVVLIPGHGDDLRYDGLLGPIGAEL